nr:MAG TPA: hypothetical protein [Caudoviricetes sp.]
MARTYHNKYNLREKFTLLPLFFLLIYHQSA